jgi:hypothetical protein
MYKRNRLAAQISVVCKRNPAHHLPGFVLDLILIYLHGCGIFAFKDARGVANSLQFPCPSG